MKSTHLWHLTDEELAGIIDVLGPARVRVAVEIDSHA
jgi:hypothetical protein